MSEPTVYTAEYVWPVGGGPSETPMGEKFVRLAEYERLRALINPDNEGAVDVVARVLMNRNGLRFGAHVAADDPIHESYRNDARAVLSTLRKEAEQ